VHTFLKTGPSEPFFARIAGRLQDLRYFKHALVQLAPNGSVMFSHRVWFNKYDPTKDELRSFEYLTIENSGVAGMYMHTGPWPLQLATLKRDCGVGHGMGWPHLSSSTCGALCRACFWGEPCPVWWPQPQASTPCKLGWGGWVGVGVGWGGSARGSQRLG
jgi:hypothetical protein